MLKFTPMKEIQSLQQENSAVLTYRIGYKPSLNQADERELGSLF